MEKKKKSEFVEEIPLVLPVLDSPHSFGALWDCKTSQFLPEKLFCPRGPGRPVLEDHLVSLPSSQQVYSLTHVKNTKSKSLSAKIDLSAMLEINLFLVKVKVNVGSAMYSNKVTTKTNEEELLVNYEQETFVVRVLPSANVCIDPDVKARLESGRLDCTHVLTEVVYGAELVASIRVKKVDKDEFEDQNAVLLGKLIIGPISLAVKAGLTALSLLNEGNEDTITVSLESNFKPPLPQPGSIPALFELVEDRLAHDLEAAQPFPYHEGGLSAVRGWPVRYFLVPVSQFVDFHAKLPRPVFRVLDGHLLEDFTAMLGRLKDFQQSESEYLRHYICQRDHRLKQMLSDKDNTLYAEVVQAERDYRIVAIRLLARSTEVYEKCQRGDETQEGLQALLAEYGVSFDPDGLESRVRDWVKRGQRALNRIHAGDMDEGVAAVVLTSAKRLKEWMAAPPNGTDEIRLLLSTGSDGSEEVPGGFLLAVYNLSKHLDPGPRGVVAVTLPDVAAEFGLRVCVDGGGWRELARDPEEVNCLLSVLATVTGSGQPVAALLHQLIVSTTHGMDIRRCQDSIIMDTCFLVCCRLQICETSISLRREIIDATKKGGQSRWKFVITLEAFESARECYDSFSRLQAAAEEAGVADQIDWVVGSFNLSRTEYTDGPLLFLFRGGQLCGAALDLLDIGVIQASLQALITDPDSIHNLNLPGGEGTLERSSRACFFPKRALFLAQVSRLFNPTLAAPSRHDRLGAVTQGGLQLVHSAPVLDAMTICRAVGSTVAPKSTLASALTYITLSSAEERECAQLEAIVIELGWDSVSKCFPQAKFEDVRWVSKLTSDLWIHAYIKGGSIFLRAIGICLDTLRACLSDIQRSKKSNVKVKDDESKLMNPEPQIQEVCKDKDCDSTTRTQVKNILKSKCEPEAKFQEIAEILVALRWQVLAKNPGRFKKLAFLMELLELLRAELADDEAGSEPQAVKNEMAGVKFGRQHTQFSRELKYKALMEALTAKLLNHFVLGEGCGIQWPDSRTKDSVKDFIHGGLYSEALRELSLLQFPRWHQRMFGVVAAAATQLLTAATALEVLDVLQTHVSQTEAESVWALCWANPQFQTLMRTGLRDSAFIHALTSIFCGPGSGHGATVRLPHYLTIEVVHAVQAHVKAQEEAQSGLGPSPESGWNYLYDVLAGLQDAYIDEKKRAVSLDSNHFLCPSFYALWRRNLAKSTPTLKESLKRIGVHELLNWDHEAQLVRQPVRMHDLWAAIELVQAHIPTDCPDMAITDHIHGPAFGAFEPGIPVLDLLLPEAIRDHAGTNRAFVLRTTKRLLSPGDSPGSIADWYTRWSNDANYRHIILAFADLIGMDNESGHRNELLHRLETECISWSTALGREGRRTLRGLYDKLELEAAREVGRAAKSVQRRKLVELIVSNEAALDCTNLQLADFFYELQRLHLLLLAPTPKETGASDHLAWALAERLGIAKLPAVVAEYLHQTSGGVPVFETPCATGSSRLSPILLQALEESAQPQVFVVTPLSFAGSGGRFLGKVSQSWCDADSPEQHFAVGVSSLQLHKIQGKERVRSRKRARTMILMQAPEYRMLESEKQQRTAKEIYFSASVSHLIIVDWTWASSIQEGDHARATEMLDTVGRILIDCARLESSPDLVFIHGGESERDERVEAHLSEFVEELTRLADTHAFELGLRLGSFRGWLEKAVSRADQGRLCISWEQLTDELCGPTGTFLHGQRSTAVSELKKALEHKWSRTEQIHAFAQREPRFHTPEHFHWLRDWNRVQGLLCVAFASHTSTCVTLLQHHLGNMLEMQKTDTPTQDDRTAFEGARSRILTTIRGLLAQVGFGCVGLAREGGVCSSCAHVTEELLKLGGDVEGNKSRLRVQTVALADSVWNQCAQMAIALGLQKFSGLGPVLDHAYTEALAAYSEEDDESVVSSILREVKFWCADQVRVPLLRTVILQEARCLYGMTPFVVAELEQWFDSPRPRRTNWPQMSPTSDRPKFTTSHKLKTIVDDAVVVLARSGQTPGVPSLHQPGMLQELQVRIQDALQTFHEAEPEEEHLSLERRWDIHVYTLKLFVECMEVVEEGWRERYDLLQAVRACKSAIGAEVRRRLEMEHKS